MNKFLFILAVLILIACNFKEQKGKIILESFIPELPKKLNENSGIIIYDDLIWTFNDSGGENKIYAVDFSGKIKKEIEIENAKNIDWEDIAQDKKNIYIGDFGNNRGARENLKIYKIKKKDIGKKKEQKVDAKEIKFEYADRVMNPSKKRYNAFDCEALIELNDHLYIFTKDRTDYTTTVYKIPKKKGKYKVKPIEKFDVKGLITGADISPDKKRLALVGYNNYQPILWLCSGFSSNSFFDGENRFFELSSIFEAQTEGVCFLGNDSVLISCEQTEAFKQQVFSIDLNSL